MQNSIIKITLFKITYYINKNKLSDTEVMYYFFLGVDGMGKKTEPTIVAHIMGKWLGGGVEAVVMNYYRHIDRNKIQFDFICDRDSTDIPYDEIKRLGGRVILVPPYQQIFKYLK